MGFTNTPEGVCEGSGNAEASRMKTHENYTNYIASVVAVLSLAIATLGMHAGV
jgi:hypothetical protein